MGMLLFDKSGTFVPSDYGLFAGDMIHVVAIGGGGSAGAAGGATSFGNLLTVAGGAAAGSDGYGGEGGWHPALPITLCSAPPNDVPMGTAMYSNAGGCGCSKILLSGSSSSLNTQTIYAPFATLYGGIGYSSSASTNSSGRPVTLNGISQNGDFNGGKGCNGRTHSSDSGDSLSLRLGGGGSGYGAGGGGGYATVNDKSSSTAAGKNGGAHGVFNWLDYVLTASSPFSFAITIGAGGASGKVSSSGYSDIYYNYGAGASGCVAIYW